MHAMTGSKDVAVVISLNMTDAFAYGIIGTDSETYEFG